MADQKNPELDALLQLERLIKSNDPSASKISPEQRTQIEAKLKTYRQQGLAKPLSEGPDVPKLTEAQSKAVGYYKNAVQANGDYEKSFDNPDTSEVEAAPPRSMIGQQMSENTPNLLNSLPSAIGNSPARQQADQAQLNFIMATLRQESGAALSAGEIQNQIRRYFPMPGDGPEVIKQKAEARRTAIDSLKAAAGPGVVPEEAPAANVVTQDDDKAASINKTGAGDIVTPEDREFKKQADALLSKGGKREDFDALAKQFNRSPFDASLDEAIRARDTGLPVSGFRITPSQHKDASAIGALAASPAGAYGIKAADVLTGGFMDEAAPILGGDAGQVRLGMDLADREHPVASTIGELSGGAMIPFGRGAKTASEMAKIGGLTGGVYGVGSGRTLDQRVTGGALGAISGTALGYGAGKLTEKIGGMTFRKANPDAPDVIGAADRLKVDVLPADVGGPTTRRLSAAVVQTPLGAGPLVEGAQRTAQQASDAASTLAGGVKADGYATGRAAQRGMENWIEDTSTRGGKLYSEIPVRPEAVAELGETKATLSALNNKITSNPELAALTTDGKLKAYEEALNKGGLSWNDLKQFRSLIGERLDGMVLQQDTAQSDLRALYGSLSKDMEATAKAQGPEALAKFQRANTYWRARQDRLDKVATAILGKDKDKGAQAAFNQIVNWSTTKGESQRIGQMMRSLPQDEKDTVSGAMIDLIGKATPGKQDAAGEAFSLQTFLTNWNKMDDRAKVALFSPQQRAALSDIATIAEGTRAGQQFANSSNTGGVNALLATGGAASTSATFLTMGYPLMAAIAAAPVVIQRPLGKLLASPKFARWIANAPSGKAQMAAHIGKLSKIAGTSPALSNDLTSLERYLLTAVNDNAPRAAASGQEKEQ